MAVSRGTRVAAAFLRAATRGQPWWLADRRNRPRGQVTRSEHLDLVRPGDQAPEEVVPAGEVARLAGFQLGGSCSHMLDLARVGSPL